MAGCGMSQAINALVHMYDGVAVELRPVFLLLILFGAHRSFVTFARWKGWINGGSASVAALAVKLAAIELLVGNHCSDMAKAIDRNSDALDGLARDARDAREQMNRVAASMNIVLAKQDALTLEVARQGRG